MERYSESEMHRFLRKLTSDSEVLSLIGMCKNAGKTTILNAILSSYMSENPIPDWGLLSIGLDGESRDRATSGHKPEIFVTEGTIFVTPAKLWNQSDVSKEILEILQPGGALGSLLILRAKSDGFIQLSGPSSRDAMFKAVGTLKKFGAQKIIIDGSINRKVFSGDESMDTLLCTGYPCFDDYHQAVQETLHVYEFYTQLPEIKIAFSEESFLSMLCGDQEQSFFTSDQIRREGVDWRSKRFLSCDGVFYRGAVHSHFLRQLGDLRTKANPIRLVVPNGSRIVAEKEQVQKFIREGNSISVLHRIPINGIFVNHRRDTPTPSEDYRLMQGIAEQVDCPVIDWKERLICTNPL